MKIGELITAESVSSKSNETEQLLKVVENDFNTI